MATALSSPLSDPGGCLICQRLALAVVLVDLGNTSKEIIRCFSITARFAGSHRSLQPNAARLPVQSVPVTIRQRLAKITIRHRQASTPIAHWQISVVIDGRSIVEAYTKRRLPPDFSNSPWTGLAQ